MGTVGLPESIRVADVISLNSLAIEPALYRFGLQAHFDFIVCRDE